MIHGRMPSELGFDGGEVSLKALREDGAENHDAEARGVKQPAMVVGEDSPQGDHCSDHHRAVVRVLCKGADPSIIAQSGNPKSQDRKYGNQPRKQSGERFEPIRNVRHIRGIPSRRSIDGRDHRWTRPPTDGVATSAADASLHHGQFQQRCRAFFAPPQSIAVCRGMMKTPEQKIKIEAAAGRWTTAGSIHKG